MHFTARDVHLPDSSVRLPEASWPIRLLTTALGLAVPEELFKAIRTKSLSTPTTPTSQCLPQPSLVLRERGSSTLTPCTCDQSGQHGCSRRQVSLRAQGGCCRKAMHTTRTPRRALRNSLQGMAVPMRKLARFNGFAGGSQRPARAASIPPETNARARSQEEQFGIVADLRWT